MKNLNKLIQKVRSFISGLKEKKNSLQEGDSLSTSSPLGKIIQFVKVKTAKKFPRLERVLIDIFSIEKRAHLHQAFLIIFTLTTCYSLGKIVSLSLDLIVDKFVTPSHSIRSFPMRQEKKVVAYDEMINSNLFKTATEEGKVKKKSFNDEEKICTTGVQKSTLDLALLNTIVLQNAKKSLATIQMRNKPEIYRLGENIGTLARLDKIDALKTVIKNRQTGACEFLEAKTSLPKGKNLTLLSEREGQKLLEKYKQDGIEHNGDHFNISQKAIDKYTKSLDEILMQAKAVQMSNPDGSLSFKITDISPGSIYSALGLENNDIIEEINGKKIHSLNEVMNMFGKIKNIQNLQLKIVKEDGFERLIDYSINQ